jgi:putative ABC transport system permease protein
MDFGPIFRALINHKSRFWLITLEIALTLAVIVNCLNSISNQRRIMNRPTGMDLDHVLVVRTEPFAADLREEQRVEQLYDEDLRALRDMPGVIAATGISAVPLSGGGSSTGRKVDGAEGDTITTPYFVVGEQALESLGVTLVEGRAFAESDFPPEIDPDQAFENEQVSTQNVILTRDLASQLFPDGGAVGKMISNSRGDDREIVVGVIERMHCSWPQSQVAERVLLYPGRPAGTRITTYLVRTEPDAVDRLYKALEPALLAIHEGRLVSIQTLAEVKANTYKDDVSLSQLLVGLSVLLVLVTSLGIVGLTSFSVTQRTREIGVRRAMGATRGRIVRHFLVENWVMTSTGLLGGLAFAFALNYGLAQISEVPRIGFGNLAATMTLLWLAGLAAALTPALRAMAVPPVTATRNVY